MSRFDYESDGEGITWEMWRHNAELALKGKRGRQALRDLREALLALPEKRLIARALCTVGVTREAANLPEGAAQWHRDNLLEYVLSQGGEGVCAVGAYAWYKAVKAGADPQAAFEALPFLPDDDGAPWETAQVGKRAGMTFTLAWELGQRNDDTYGELTPEQRYVEFLAWIDRELAGFA